VDLMLQFRFERGGDGTKRYRKLKRGQRAHLDLIRSKYDTARRWWLEEMRHWGGEAEETISVRLMPILLGQKIKKIYTVDSADTNGL
jgi:hypothetical protein